jgi:hypothetical protein
MDDGWWHNSHMTDKKKKEYKERKNYYIGVIKKIKKNKNYK